MRFDTILLSAVLSLAATSCGQGQEGGEALGGKSVGDGVEVALNTSSPKPVVVDTRAASAAAVPGTSLPMAKPATSALFNAAYHRTAGDWEPVMFLCDGVNGEQVRLVTTPDARGLSRMWTYAKSNFAAASQEVRIGDQDPGAGQVFRELRRPDGRAIGSIHSINPGILGSAEVTTLPTLSSITAGRKITPCRWIEEGRVLFVDARRTVLITAERRGSYIYRSFDHSKPGAPVGSMSSIATATVSGGRLIHSHWGVETYEFKAGPWTYQLTASASNRAPGATLVVGRAGKTLTRSMAVAYEMAAARRD